MEGIVFNFWTKVSPQSEMVMELTSNRRRFNTFDVDRYRIDIDLMSIPLSFLTGTRFYTLHIELKSSRYYNNNIIFIWMNSCVQQKNCNNFLSSCLVFNFLLNLSIEKFKESLITIHWSVFSWTQPSRFLISFLLLERHILPN